MMRTIKKKIENWRLAAVGVSMALCFAVIACQDQLIEEVANSTISQTADYPADVKAHVDDYLRDHPNAKLTYMEGEANEMDKFTSTEQVSSRIIYNYTYKKSEGNGKKGVLLTDVTNAAENLKTQDKVFLVVEKAPEYPGGFDKMKGFIEQNLKYPAEDASKGISGTSFVSFVINETGTMSDITIIKGVSPTIDAEAVRIVKMFPNWIPGQQNGVKVKTRFVVPIPFGKPSPKSDATGGVPNGSYRMKVNYNVVKSGNEILVSGQVTNANENGKPMSGVNLVVAGGTYGTATDAKGNFSIKLEKPGKLVASFVGFESEVIPVQ